MADLAELGIIYVEQGYEAAIQHMSAYKDVAAEVVQSEDDRVKAAGKVIQSQAALSDQIARTTVAFNSSKSAQFEFQAAALGVTNQLEKQIQFLRNLEEQAAFTAEAQKASIRWAREEEGALLDLAKDIQYLNKVRAEEAAKAEADRKKELASREAYYAKIISDAKAAEQAITDAKHKALVQQKDATAQAIALYTKEENERVKAANKAAAEVAKVQKKAADDSAKAAEQAAIAEIQWAKKSRDEQIRIKEEIAAYKKAGVSDATLGNMFGAGALNGPIKEVSNLAEKWNHVTLNTSRARSEMVVLAHEAVQGRFSRIPASMMVFAEYTDLTALALSGVGLAVMGTIAALAGLSIAVVKGLLEQRELQNALILTGNYAGSTSGQMDELAHSSVKAGGSLALAKGVILDLAQSGKFTATQISEVTNAVVKMEYATGGGEDSIKGLVNGFKSLQVEANSHSRYSDQITQAVLKLDAQYHFVTSSVFEHIRALESEGKAKEASAIATDEFAKAVKSRAEEMVANLGTIERGWRSIKEAIGEAWSAVKDFGKTDTIQSRLQEAKDKLEKLKDPTISIGYQTINLGTDHRRKLQIEQQEIVNQLSKELLRTQDRALEQGERAARQSEANVAYGSLQLKLVQLKADKEGEIAKFTREQNSNLEKMIASPTATPEFIAKVTKETQDVIAAFSAKVNKGKQVADSYNQIAASIEAANQKALASIETGEKVSATEQLRITTMKQINLAYENGTLTLEKKTRAIKLLDVALANTTAATERVQRQKDEIAALEVIDKAQEDAAKSYNKMIDAALSASKRKIDSLDAQIARQAAHNAEIGKTKEQIDLIRATQQDADTKALEAESDRLSALIEANEQLKVQQGIVDTLTPQQEEMSRITLNGLDREIQRRRDLKNLLLEGAVLEANAAAAKRALAEWKKGWESVDKLAQDAFKSWAENGKSAAEVIGQALKAALLDAIYQATLKPVVAQLYVSATSSLGIPGMGGGGGGSIGDILNKASSGNSLYNNISGLFGGSSSTGASIFALGGAAPGASAALPLVSEMGALTGLTEAGTSIFSLAAPATTGVTLGTLAPSLGAATTAATTSAVAAPLAAGAAPAMGIPGIGWALGGALLLAGLTSGDNGPKLASTGDAIRRYDKGGALTENATNGAWFFTNTDDANKLLDGLESRYQKAAKALGIGTVATQFDYGSNNRGNFALAGAAGNSRANTGEIAYSADAMQVAASRAVFAALQGSELPKYLSGLLDSVGDINALSQTQIDDLLNTAQAFKGLHDVMVQMPFDALHDLSYDAAKGLIEFSGGLDKLTQNLGTYYENFYSAEEKKAQTLANITKTLTDAGALTKTTRTAIAGEFDVRVGAQGDARLEQRYATSVENLDMPKTREEFRALVESMKDLGGESAQKAYAALMSVSGAFASITPAAADAAAALEKDLAARATWQQKLDVLTGKTTEQQIERANDLAGVTNEATAALIKQVHAQQDIAMSATKAAEAMKAVAAANASIQGSKTQIYNVENAIAPERAALTAAQEAWAGAIKEIKDIAVNSFGQSQSDVAKWGAAEIEGFKVEDFADSEFFDSVQQALTDYWADKAALITANDSFAKAEAAAKDAAAKSLIDTHHDGLAKGNQIRDAELSLKARLYELTGDAGKLADVVKEQRDIIASGLSTTQADLQRQIWAAEDKTTGGAGKDILAERNNLQAELNALTDTAAQALARQRDALDESNRALFDNIQATKAAKAIADQRTELESRLAIATGASTALEISRKNELAAALDFSNRIMLESIYAAEDLASANEKAAASAKEAAAATLQNASANASQALAGVQRAVDAQKKLAQVQVDVAQESVSNLSSIFNSLKANVAQLYGSVESTTRQSAAQGNNFIAQALATAKSTGYFPDADDLADAVAAAMQGVDGNVYKSQADADFAKLSLAGSLSGLKDLSKTGLTTAEKALEAAKNQLTVLDQTLETARAQLDAVNGVNTSVLSVAAALDAFGAALGGLQAAKNASVAQYVGTATSAVPTGSRSHIDYKAGTTQLSGNDKPMATAELAKNVAQSWANAIGNPAVEDNVRRFMRDLELTPSALGIVLPGFASGINRVPYDMQAIIHKDEAVVPAAFNPFNPNAQQGSAGNARLEALVEGLTAEVQRLQAIVNDGNKQTRRTADAVNGNPEMPMLVETV